MAKSKIDAKEFMLQYGDRIGLGIAGLLALLFVIFAVLGGGGGVSAEQVKESSKKADEAIKRSEINPEKIALKDVADVKPLNQIDELSKALTRPIAMDQLHLPYRYFEHEPKLGRFRSNPNVMQVLEIVATPLVGQFRRYETRVINGVEEAMVLTPRDARNAPKFGNQGNNRFNPGRGGLGGAPGGGLGAGGGGLGAGGGGGLGAGGGGGLGAGGGNLGMDGGGGSGNRQGNKAGGAGGDNAKTKASSKPAETKLGGDESIYTFDWRKQVNKDDLLGVTLLPLRTAMIAATFPHARQTEEIAKRLQIQKHEVERLYRRIDVQRRRIFLKGMTLPDGRMADAEYVELDNPKDRSRKEYKLLAEVDKLAAAADDQTSEKDRSTLAGWTDVNILNVANIMMSAYSVTKFNNEGFYTEKEPIIEGLVDYAGPRMAMRLPRMVRGEYPDIFSKLSILMGAVKKIKEDEKAKIPPPPKDSRLSSANGGDEFDKLAGNDDEKKDEKKQGDAPELSGPIPEYIPIRFIDVDLPTNTVGGSVFEYRIRVVLNNPNYKQEKLVAAPEFAREETLNGPWSNTTRVTFAPDTMIFAGDRERAKGSTDDREKDKAPVQIHKWLAKVEVGDRDYSIVGDWWIDRLLVGRGEYIGRSPDLTPPAGETNMVLWVSHALDTIQQKIGADVMKKVRTPDLYTNSILVDFQGGAFQSFRSAINGNNKREDIPAEVLILEPDGRLIARHLSDDRHDEGRKQRYDHWKNWIDKLAKPGDKKPAAGGGGLGKE